MKEKNIEMSLTEVWEKGGEGAIDLAEKITKMCKNEKKLKEIYNENDSIREKIEKVACKIYGAEGIELSDNAKKKIKVIEDLGYSKFPICIAKTQYSLSDDPKNLLCKEPFMIHVKDVQLKAGAEFIVILTGKIMTMPGLPKVPAAEQIDLNEKGDIIGIF